MVGRLDFMVDMEVDLKISAFEDFVKRLKKYTEIIKKIQKGS